MSIEIDFSKFGYRFDLEDRHELLMTSTPLPEDLMRGFAEPEEIDPRPWHRIENQGSMGSCQGHALSSVCEMAYHITTGNVIQFSPLYAYLGTQELDGLLGRDVGSTIEGGLRLVREKGICPLEFMPYPNPVRYTSRIPQEARDAARPFKIRSHTFCKSYADVYQFLASGQGGVSIGIGWGNFDSDGLVETYRIGRGGHAVALLGYSKRQAADGRKYLWLANSWATSWGVNGWAEVSPRAIDQMFQASYTVMIGMSDLETPKPRYVDFSKSNVMA
jgi:hypothetical protein